MYTYLYIYIYILEINARKSRGFGPQGPYPGPKGHAPGDPNDAPRDNAQGPKDPQDTPGAMELVMEEPFPADAQPPFLKYIDRCISIFINIGASTAIFFRIKVVF